MAAFFRVDASDVSSALLAFRRDITPFQLAYTLTKVAQDIRDGERETMRQVFDRPRPFTLNALFVKPATKTDPTAIVHFKEGFGSVPAWRFLGPQVEGGQRRKKSHERALERAGILRNDEFCVPGSGVALDTYGNMKGGQITQILSRLGASPDPMQNMTGKSKKRAKRKGAAMYFVARKHPKLKDGVYQRTASGVLPVLIFVKAPRYTKRFPFYERAQQIFRERFAVRAREAWTRYPPRRARAA